MKRGFTLVELLAVITILSIILLIVVPMLNGVIRDSKENSNKDSINLYGKAIENAVATYFAKYPDEDYVSYEKLQEEKMINYRGNKVECDTIYIVERKVYLADCKVGGKIVEGSYGTKIENMLGEATIIDDNNVSFINTGINSKFISKFTIATNGTDIENSNEYESKDCSFNQDKSVMCYWKEDLNNSGYYEMIVAANGEIYTPYNSKSLFFNFGKDNLEELNLTGLNTKYTLNMQTMFRATGVTLMTNLDLGDSFDTSNVTNMRAMFLGTGANNLGNLDLGDKFDTSNVTNMENMFDNMGHNSNNMTKLDLGNKFDTSNVTEMQYMFIGTGETALKYLNLGKNFVINDDTSIDAIFANCGIQNNTMRVIVPTTNLQNKILGLNETNDRPSFWNNTIVQVQ